MIEVTEEMIEAGAKTVWSQGTRGLFERKQHISNILDAALAATPTRATTPTANSELVESLRFYAEEANWMGGPWVHAPPTRPYGTMIREPSAIEADRGDLARAALTEAGRSALKQEREA